MKRALLITSLLVGAAGLVFVQTTSTPVPNPAALMPSGALLYLESPDFARLLRDWDESKVKSDWLDSDNYAAFSRSVLFTKLGEVYGQYGEAAGFAPGLPGVREIAGSDSALALYGIRDVEFLYISRVGEADLMKSQLWAVRDKFEQRQAAGVTFYLRTDPASKRTAAFAFAKGLLLLATRDDLVAQSLELLAGGTNPSVASDRWYRDASAAAPNPGELRLVMNLEALVRSDYFRSYWVQRNASAVRRYWAGVADVRRSSSEITESRVFLSRETAASPVPVGALISMVPPEAGTYRASAVNDLSEAAAILVQKLIGPRVQRSRDPRYAPMAISADNRAGSEGDLETRIDEQPLPADAGVSDSEAAIRDMLQKGRARSSLLVQASSPPVGSFVPLGSVIVLTGDADWDRDSVRSALASAAGKLWTTSQLGAAWVGGTAGNNAVERLDGLGALMFAARGRLLFIGNDARLLGAVLDRAANAPGASTFTYAAGVRHRLEQANFERVMRALDFGSPANGPTFFSGNIGSLSRVLLPIDEVKFTEEDRGVSTAQTVVYRLVQ
ncbi:MAG TPA: hypothetical protein VKU19_38735 [Bryobacteraceae bacterium]|nr:hypothetical protein [Bryobacteraceae bacterium]